MHELELIYQRWNTQKNGLFFLQSEGWPRIAMGAFRETDILAGGRGILKTVTRMTLLILWSY